MDHKLTITQFYPPYIVSTFKLRHKVLTVILMNMKAFWDVTAC